MRLSLSALFVFISFQLFAQAPQVLDISPLNQKVGVGVNTPISVPFDVPIDPATMNFGKFKVFGRWSASAGLYLVKLESDLGIEIKKVLKQQFEFTLTGDV